MPTARTRSTRTTPNDERTGLMKIPSATDPLWSIKDVSEYLGIPVQTLYQWRHQGSGPKAYRCGRHLRYSPGEVLRWLTEEAA